MEDQGKIMKVSKVSKIILQENYNEVEGKLKDIEKRIKQREDKRDRVVHSVANEAAQYSKQVLKVQAHREELDGPLDPVKMQRVFDDLSKIPKYEKFRVSYFPFFHFLIQEKEMKQQVKKMKTERESRSYRAQQVKRGNQGDVKEMLQNLQEKDEKREQLVISRR